VLTGEQSNTSIVFEAPGRTPVICKLFRALHHGDNPDVELQTVLAGAGSAVPRSIGHVIADWSDRGRDSGRARGHLAFAQEYLVGARDGWAVALEAAAAGRDFGDDARMIGIATAGVHATLAATMATAPTGRAEIDATLEQARGRLTAAIAEVPGIGAHAASIQAILEFARSAAWPAQQRIHGDLHLGQVLAVPDRGWMLVDFEGEPLRPMVERCRLDTPLRDVAGMLRSFDYVAGALAAQGRPAPEGWAPAARAAFESGYADASGCDIRENRTVLDALELDKALYEAVYEARNRPTWLRIPVAAIARLSARSLA
jgi:predicted trehalose synthase